MSHTEHHLEHAEHAQHAALDPLDRMVAMSMTIIAALLAAAAMISHRGHTETLRLTTEASDQWSFYQAKKIRTRAYESFIPMMEVLQPKPGTESVQKKALADWDKIVQRYKGSKNHKGDLAEIKEKAEELQKASHGIHHNIDWIDYGHLGLELALILCSIAVLTKQRGFWYIGLAAAAVGLAVVLIGVAGLLEHGHI
jgi:hypothetical protein